MEKSHSDGNGWSYTTPFCLAPDTADFVTCNHQFMDHSAMLSMSNGAYEMILQSCRVCGGIRCKYREKEKQTNEDKSDNTDKKEGRDSHSGQNASE